MVKTGKRDRVKDSHNLIQTTVISFSVDKIDFGLIFISLEPNIRTNSADVTEFSLPHHPIQKSNYRPRF
jgi:hypothetical protein